MNVDKVTSKVLNMCGEKKSLGRQYMEWLDTKPKAFLSYRDWLLTYHEEEYKKL